MRIRRASVLVVAAALGVLGTASCAERKKINECNALITVINSAVDRIQQGTRAEPDAGLGEFRGDLADVLVILGPGSFYVELGLGPGAGPAGEEHVNPGLGSWRQRHQGTG